MRRIAVSLALIVGALIVGSSPSGATPVETGCPTGYDYRSLTEWADMGYGGAPPFVDATGNSDGYVCGLQLPEGYTWGRFVKALDITPGLDVLYLFTDNGSPARKG